MSSPNRTQREKRIKEDSGDKDDTVWYTLKHRNGGGRAYHEDQDCSYMHGEQYSTTRGKAHRREFYPCKYCVLDFKQEPTHTSGQKSKLEQLLEEGKVDTKHTEVHYEA